MLGSKCLRMILAAMVLVMMMPMIASASIRIESDYFFEKPFPATFCAELDPAVAGIPVTFKATTPQGIVFNAGPINTNVLGLACATVNWPVGIYSIVATGNSESNFPYAISVFSALNFCGAQAGGARNYLKYGVPPNVMTSLEPREVDFAMIYRTTSPKNFGVIFDDPENPLGSVRFVAKGFQIVVPKNNGDWQSMEFYGSGTLTQGMNAPKTVHYYLYVDDYPNDNWWFIKLTDFANHVLYVTDQNEKHFDEGKVVVELCP